MAMMCPWFVLCVPHVRAVCSVCQETNETHTPLNHLAKSCIPSLPKSIGISTAPEAQVRQKKKLTQRQNVDKTDQTRPGSFCSFLFFLLFFCRSQQRLMAFIPNLKTDGAFEHSVRIEFEKCTRKTCQICNVL